MDYIITTYPTLYRKYLVKDATNEEEAWTKYDEELPEPIDEGYLDSGDNNVEIEVLTPEVRIQYGLEDTLKPPRYAWS